MGSIGPVGYGGLWESLGGYGGVCGVWGYGVYGGSLGGYVVMELWWGLGVWVVMGSMESGVSRGLWGLWVYGVFLCGLWSLWRYGIHGDYEVCGGAWGSIGHGGLQCLWGIWGL